MYWLAFINKLSTFSKEDAGKKIKYLTLDISEDDSKVMSSLEKNKVQLAAPSISKLIEKNTRLQLFDFPFLFKDIDEVQEFYDNAKDKLFYLEDGIQYLDANHNLVVLMVRKILGQIFTKRDFTRFSGTSKKPIMVI
jgi:hypothetical protein